MKLLTTLNRKWWWLPIVILVALTVHSFTPLPKGGPSNCTAVAGRIEDVRTGGGPGDVVIKISGRDGHYYINRGLENGINLDTLSKQLLNKFTTVYYINHWTLLNFSGKTRHIARIEIGEQVAYNEWSAGKE